MASACNITLVNRCPQKNTKRSSRTGTTLEKIDVDLVTYGTRILVQMSRDMCPMASFSGY
jgi:hypothetical protein